MINIIDMTPKMIIISLLFFIITIANGQTSKVIGTVAFKINEKDLIPEGITYDPANHNFFISSINKEKVVMVNENGVASDFLASGQDGILQTLGMKVDVLKRRLWVVSNKDGNNRHQSAVHIFDIESGKLIKKFLLEKDTAHLFNDLALSANGDAFITDSYSHVIYTVPADLSGLRTLAESGSFLKGSNGLTVSPDNKILYVATAEGITMINLKTLDIIPIRTDENITASGIDGLVFYKGSLIGVTNSKNAESEMFIARYRLSPAQDEITDMIFIDKGNPLFNLPTTCVIAEDYLYCLANTSLRVFFQDKSNSQNKLQDPIVLKYKISE
jgi:DNA-binding beta-propeller fold protein YncE